jgi:hypothetical protein
VTLGPHEAATAGNRLEAAFFEENVAASEPSVPVLELELPTMTMTSPNIAMKILEWTSDIPYYAIIVLIKEIIIPIYAINNLYMASSIPEIAMKIPVCATQC